MATGSPVIATIGSVVGFALEDRSPRSNDVHHIGILAHDLGDQCPRARYILLPAITLNSKVLALDMTEASQLREQRAVVAVLAFFLHQRCRFAQTENGKAPHGGRLRR